MEKGFVSVEKRNFLLLVFFGAQKLDCLMLFGVGFVWSQMGLLPVLNQFVHCFFYKLLFQCYVKF